MRIGRRWGTATLLWLAIACATAVTLEAHAILIQASPAANSTVQGPDAMVRLKFNSRIDGTRSRISLLLPDKTEKVLKIQEQGSPETLVSKASGLLPGTYRLRWQVLATDGHVTRGEYGFNVR